MLRRQLRLNLQFRRMDGENAREDGGATCETQTSANGDTDRLLEAITFCRTSLTAQIEEVKMDISLIRQDFQKLRDRVTTAETQLGLVEGAIPPLQTGSDRKQDDMENRLWRCNLRLLDSLKARRVRTRPHSCSSFSLPPMAGRPSPPLWQSREPTACRLGLRRGAPPYLYSQVP